MVNWFCFKFWFCFRLVLACMAHFNWFAAIYVNCIYFTLWKSYDILWFWTHLALCACFPALRPENYLLVFFKLVQAKRGEHANKSYKEIYELLYKDRTSDETSAERELRRIDTIRKERRESRRRQQLGGGNLKPSSPSADQSSDSDDDGSVSMPGHPYLYPRLGSPDPKSDLEEQQAMPNIRLDRTKKRTGKLLGPGENEDLVSYVTSTEDSTSQRSGGRWRRFVPNFISRQPLSAEAAQAKREAKERDLERARAKKEESEQKLLAKKARREQKKRQMAELRRRARIERRRKNFADAVDLLLTYLRLISSFAIMVGNIHKTFIPRYLAPPLDNVYDSPDLLMVFAITILIDVGLFWILVFWSYCQQMALCCRLDFCRFLAWCCALILLGGGLMFGPMHFIHEQLDETWCLFQEGQPLSEYFDG